MSFLAHTANAAGQLHLLRDHLHGVGALARRFAAIANAELAEAAQWAGLLHDLGKGCDECQEPSVSEARLIAASPLIIGLSYQLSSPGQFPI
jgi:HD superfamily phosphohydrolase YqeK